MGWSGAQILFRAALYWEKSMVGDSHAACFIWLIRLGRETPTEAAPTVGTPIASPAIEGQGPYAQPAQQDEKAVEGERGLGVSLTKEASSFLLITSSPSQ